MYAQVIGINIVDWKRTSPLLIEQRILFVRMSVEEKLWLKSFWELKNVDRKPCFSSLNQPHDMYFGITEKK